MTDLPVDATADLGGVSILAAGVSGLAGQVRWAPEAGSAVRDLAPQGLPEVLAEDAVPERGAQVLGREAEEAGFRYRLSVPLDALTPQPGAVEPRVEVTVPAPAEDEAQAVLEVDDFGLVHWHFAGGGDGEAAPVRGDDITQTFTIPVRPVELDGEGPAGDRGIAGLAVRKVLHLVRFPVERAGGGLARLVVGGWESRNRPYGLHRASPEYFAGRPDPAAPELFDGHVLLLVHGTFSVGRSGFAGIGADPAFLKELSHRYDGRVVVFDHPSVHVGPDENVRRLLETLPAGHRPTFDVVAHSRGGLVARQLAAQGDRAPAVHRIIHVATPNAGTTLASPDHLGDLLDMFSNLVTAFTDEGSGVIAAAVLEVVKQVASGALHGLDGLAAMDPAAPSLARINAARTAPATSVSAITSDYDSSGATTARRALDFLADRVFGAGNDLVVPTTGVYEAGSYRVDDRLDLSGTAPSLAHSGYFHDSRVLVWLADHLSGS